MDCAAREMSDHKIFTNWTMSWTWWLQMRPSGVPAVFPQDQREVGADSQREAVWLQRDVHFRKVRHVPAKAQQDLGDVQHHFYLLCPARLEDRGPRNHGHKVSSRCFVTVTGLHSCYFLPRKVQVIGKLLLKMGTIEKEKKCTFKILCNEDICLFQHSSGATSNDKWSVRTKNKIETQRSP